MQGVKYTGAQKFASLSLVAMPVLSCYNLFGTALTKFIFLAIVFYFILIEKSRINVPPNLRWFLLYAFTIPQIIAIISGNTSLFWGSYISLSIYFATFVCLMPHLRLHLIMRYYRIVVYFAIIIFILQEISSFTIGTRFGVLIPFLDMYNGATASEFLMQIKYSDRSCSIFSEPSHFAQYLAPYLALVLHESDNKGLFLSIEAIVISLVYIFMRSGNGYFLLAIIWIVYFLMSKLSAIKKIFIILPLSAILLVYGYKAFEKSEIGDGVLNRVETLDPNYSGHSMSAYIRIYRGFLVYDVMSPVMRFFGVGLGGSNDVIDKSSVNWMFENEHYLNNASGFLIAFGYIGTFFLFSFLFSLCSKKRPGTIIVIAAFIILCFMESFLFDSRMLLYMLLPYTIKSSDDNGMSTT